SHDRGCSVAREFGEKLRRFVARFWPGELAFDRENVLPQPGKQLALTPRYGGILRQMRVTIDQAGENRDSSVIDPANLLRPLHPTEVIVIASFDDSAVIDDDRPTGPASQRTKARSID